MCVCSEYEVSKRDGIFDAKQDENLLISSADAILSGWDEMGWDGDQRK